MMNRQDEAVECAKSRRRENEKGIGGEEDGGIRDGAKELNEIGRSREESAERSDIGRARWVTDREKKRSDVPSNLRIGRRRRIVNGDGDEIIFHWIYYENR